MTYPNADSGGQQGANSISGQQYIAGALLMQLNFTSKLCIALPMNNTSKSALVKQHFIYKCGGIGCAQTLNNVTLSGESCIKMGLPKAEATPQSRPLPFSLDISKAGLFEYASHLARHLHCASIQPFYLCYPCSPG